MIIFALEVSGAIVVSRFGRVFAGNYANQQLETHHKTYVVHVETPACCVSG